jgi:hypothetical protein
MMTLKLNAVLTLLTIQSLLFVPKSFCAEPPAAPAFLELSYGKDLNYKLKMRALPLENPP